jgi:hypothetical protein
MHNGEFHNLYTSPNISHFVHQHPLAVKTLAHLLTRSDLIRQKVSLKVALCYLIDAVRNIMIDWESVLLHPVKALN